MNRIQANVVTDKYGTELCTKLYDSFHCTIMNQDLAIITIKALQKYLDDVCEVENKAIKKR